MSIGETAREGREIVTARKIRDVVALANQRPAFSVYANALTRHVIYRLPEAQHPHLTADALDDDGYDPSDNQTRRWAALGDKLNGFIEHCQGCFDPTRRPERLFYRRDVDPNAERNADGVWLVPGSESLVCEMQVAGPGRPRYRLRVDNHLETITFTYLVDHIDEQSEIGRILAHLSSPGDLNRIYDRFWDSDEYDNPWARIWEVERELKIGTEGERFAEFRGVVVRTPGQPFDPIEQERLVRAKAADEAHLEMGGKGKRLTWGIRDYLTRHEAAIREFVLNRTPDGKPADDGLTEAVVCGMLDGQALYASPLAARNTEVRYFAVYDGASASQLGRLVRRFHTMGELRLLALVDLHNSEGRGLRRAGQAIRRLGKRIDAALGSGDALNAKQVGDLSRAHARISESVSGGIIYRTERSEHYWKSFADRLQDFRIVRLEGWQAYDAFVKRYLFPEYEFIASVGRRYRSMGQRIDRLMFLHQSEVAQRQHDDNFKISTQMSESMGQLRKLQDRAETIAYVALTYYGYALSEPFIAASLPRLLKAIASGLDTLANWPLVAGVPAFLSTIAAWLRKHADQAPKALEELIGAIVIGLVVIFLARLASKRRKNIRRARLRLAARP